MSGQGDESSGAHPKIDRETTTPFHLKLFYRQHSFHHLSDFPIPLPQSSGNSNAPASVPPLPPHLQIYTWQSCTLRELAQLLTSCLPSLLPNPAVGTRLSFRLIYPDTRGQAAAGGLGGGSAAGETRGRYLSKDMGSVVIGPRDGDTRRPANGDGRQALRLQGEDADKTLQDVRFVIGDYVDCAILPPLADGSIAPASLARGVVGNSSIGGGMRAFSSGTPARENGYGRLRPQGGGSGRAGGFSGSGQVGVPSGEWRRGERLPDTGGRWYNRSLVRNRGRPY